MLMALFDIALILNNDKQVGQNKFQKKIDCRIIRVEWMLHHLLTSKSSEAISGRYTGVSSPGSSIKPVKSTQVRGGGVGGGGGGGEGGGEEGRA
jgi:uncharacterized membrane protein